MTFKTVFYKPYNQNYNYELQVFMNNINVPSNSTIYYNFDTEPYQAELLIIELKCDSFLKNGNWEDFLNNLNSYCIVDKNELLNYDVTNIDIIYSDDGYSLCKQKS